MAEYVLCEHLNRRLMGNRDFCDDCGATPIPEPTSPSVDTFDQEYLIRQCRACAKKVQELTKERDRSVADAERLAKDNRELKEELKLRNEDIEDYKLRTKNLSRKIVEDRKKREFVGGVHGS